MDIVCRIHIFNRLACKLAFNAFINHLYTNSKIISWRFIFFIFTLLNRYRWNNWVNSGQRWNMCWLQGRHFEKRRSVQSSWCHSTRCWRCEYSICLQIQNRTEPYWKLNSHNKWSPKCLDVFDDSPFPSYLHMFRLRNVECLSIDTNWTGFGNVLFRKMLSFSKWSKRRKVKEQILGGFGLGQISRLYFER